MNTDRNLAPNRSSETPERFDQRLVVTPRVDVFENQDEVLLVADLPGVAKDGVDVHVDKGQLTIEARRRGDVAAGTLVAREYRPRDYLRVFAIPRSVDGSKIDASLSQGVLRVRLPKSEAVKPRRIEVTAK